MFSNYPEIAGFQASIVGFEQKEDGSVWPEPIDIRLPLGEGTSSAVLVSLSIADARTFATTILEAIHHVEDEQRAREIEALTEGGVA